MSIDTLLEAAKFVEWSDQIESARGQNDPGLFSLSQNGQSRAAVGGPSYLAVSSSPGSSPSSYKSLSPVRSSRQQLSTSNTDTFDEVDDKRSGTREVHNKLEKNRRAQLKDCFDNLRDQIPNMDNKKLKPSNLSILQGALRYLQALKRKERELEYEMERLARQKILYQEKLARMSGCSLPPWKKAEPEPKEEGVEEEETPDDKEDDRDSVSTSTSTASEAEEEERKSRAQSPENKLSLAAQITDSSGLPTARSAPLMDHVIKVTQSIKEQSGPFVISRQIVTRVPVSTAVMMSQQQQHHQVAAQMPAVVKMQSSNTKKTNQSQAVKGSATKTQQLVVGAKPQVGTTKDNIPYQEPEMQRVAASQKVVIRSPSAVQQVKAQPTTCKPSTAKPLAVPKQPALSPAQQSPVPKITSHVVRQFNSHSSAVSAVQEHLKNKAQNKLPQQPKNPVRTISYPMPTAETVPVKANVSMVTTQAVATTSSTGVSRQTVSQLLGKQSMVIRQPVRRTDNRFVMQRVLAHPFSPRSQMVDIVPKAPTTVTCNDLAKAQGSQSIPNSITVVTYKEPPFSNTATSIAAVATSSAGALGVSKQNVPSSVQHVAPPPGLDMRNLISHGVVLPSIPHYLSAPGLTTTVLRPSLTNPGVLTAANAALLNQAMVAGARSVAPQLAVPASKDNSPAKLQSPVAGSVSFFSTAVAPQTKVSTVLQTKAPSLSYTTPVTPGHQFLTPGLTLQPALTQVLFTQPPIAAYSIANSSPAHTLVKTTLSPQSVIRHPMAATAAVNMPQVVTTMAAVIGTNTSNPLTTVAMTIPPVVTIGALSLNPLLNTNRALVTAPTYTTLGQYPHYRFPFAGQVPIISPVAFTGNPGNAAALPVTSVGSQVAANGKTNNGVIVHTVAVPAAIPVTSSWLNATAINNGIPVKELALPVPPAAATTTSASNVVMVTTRPAATLASNSSQEGSVADSRSSSGSKVLVTSSS